MRHFQLLWLSGLVLLLFLSGLVYLLGGRFCSDFKTAMTQANAEGVLVVNKEPFSLESEVSSVINDSAFTGFGRLIFPVDRTLPPHTPLHDAGKAYIWYSYIKPERTVSIVNELKARTLAGEQVFYDIYSPAEKAKDPDKNDTGIFFFRGSPQGKTAIISAGGGFVYVGAMHDSFPHAQELAKRGYNAFAIIYRPGAREACEDLARAIALIHKHADELNVDVRDYSLWGGSAGARMAAWVGSYGTKAFGEKEYPKPATVIMQYTGLSEVTGAEPPTYSCVGTADSIASYHTMEQYTARIQANGTAAEIEVFPGLSHGFGLGEGTVADGWLEHAVSFWQQQMKNELE